MFDLLKFLRKETSPSKNIAKERLKLVLIHDRANISPHFLDAIRGDIIKVISNYMEIEDGELDIHLTNLPKEGDGFSSALVANIPIRRMKDIGKNKG